MLDALGFLVMLGFVRCVTFVSHVRCVGFVSYVRFC